MPETEPALRAPDKQRPVLWGTGDAVGGWLVAQLGGFVVSGLVLAANGLSVDQVDMLSLAWVAVSQLGLWFGLLGAPWVATRLKGNGIVQDLWLRFKTMDLPIGAFAGVATQYGVALLYLPVLRLLDISEKDYSAPARNLSDRASGPVGITLLVLIVGVGAPIIEEIFYRGLVQRSLIRRLGRWPGLIITAVWFGASHFEPLQFPALVIFGLVCGLLVERYGRLGPSIFAHMIFNLTAVVTLVAS